MDRSSLIKLIDDYSARTGLKPSTICQHAVAYGKLYEGMKRGLARDAEYGRRIVQWMADNPRHDESSGSVPKASCLSDEDGDAAPDCNEAQQ